jgi:hypothetical protein
MFFQRIDNSENVFGISLTFLVGKCVDFRYREYEKKYHCFHMYLLVDDEYNLIQTNFKAQYSILGKLEYECAIHPTWHNPRVPQEVTFDELNMENYRRYYRQDYNKDDYNKYKFVIEENFFAHPRYNTFVDGELELTQEGKEIKEIVDMYTEKLRDGYAYSI